MERILVGMDVQEAALGAVYRAIHLAQRIKAPVYILMVSSPSADMAGEEVSEELEGSARKRLELMIEMGRSDGVTINYYLARGDYEEEVIRFVEEKNITLLMLGFLEDEPGRKTIRGFRKTLSNIRKRINCSIELVYQKGSSLFEGDELPREEKGE
jgi:nucleotide-binding universal stress UspA family protein